SERRLSRSTPSTATMSSPMTGLRNSRVTEDVNSKRCRTFDRVTSLAQRPRGEGDSTGAPVGSETAVPCTHERRYNARLFPNPGSSHMYAVVKTGGKQYKVAPGEKLKVEQIPADVGAEVVLDQVLMVGEGDNVRLGQPIVQGATVKATVVAQ